MDCVVDEAAVGAAAIDEAIPLRSADELGMTARHFRIVQLDAIGAVASDADVFAEQIELLALIDALGDDHARQSRSLHDGNIRGARKTWAVDQP